MPTEPFTVAVAQIAAVAFDRAASIEKMADWARRAAGRGARLLLFPEAVVSGYPASLDWGGESAAFRAGVAEDEYRRYWRGALDLRAGDGSSGVADIADIARANGLYLVAGVIERDGGTLYCTALSFGPDGRLLGARRKLVPTVAERLVWGRGDGSTLAAHETELGRLGAVICWENYMPLLRATMYAQGVQLYCAPTADDSERWLNTMRHIAFEGGCYVLSACQYARRGDFPADYGGFPSDDDEFVVLRGASCIVDPFGEFVVEPQVDGETLLTARLDPAQIVRAKYKFDAAGHYARPDVFRLGVDRRAQSSLYDLAAPDSDPRPRDKR